MQYDENEKPSENYNRLNFDHDGLDAALKELGMLATTTNSRNEYMKEISSNPCSSSLKINTRYVSNVSIGFKVKPSVPRVRYKPFPFKRRNRTKSENSDNENVDFIQNILDSCVEEITHLKKAKSLESIVCESNQSVDFKELNFGNLPEIEVVSDSIQNLRVVE